MTESKILRRGGIRVTREDGHEERTRGRYWLHSLPGDLVIRQSEPDRIGRVEALNFGLKCTVRWLVTDTVERDVPMSGLTKIGEAPDETPKTWAEIWKVADSGKSYWSTEWGLITIPMARSDEELREFWEERLSFFEDWPLEALPTHVAAAVAAARERYGEACQQNLRTNITESTLARNGTSTPSWWHAAMT